MHRVTLLLGASAALVLSACSGAAQGPPATSSVNPTSPSYGTLELAVGTANIYGTETGMNVVTSFRQAGGKSAVLLDTPSITGPFTLPAAVAAGSGVDGFATAPVGPSLTEVTAGGELTGTTQALRLGSVACDSAALTGACPAGYTPNTSTFGQSGGVFANGLQPSNSTNNGVPYTYTPYAEPLFDTTMYASTPWGGPPAYDPDGHKMGVRDGLNNLGSINGYVTGLTTFAGVTPAAGAYALSLSIGSIGSSGQSSYSTVSTTATLTSTALLPTIATPILAEDGAGGGAITVLLQGGETEALVFIEDYGPGGTPGSTNGQPNQTANCQGPLSPGAGAGPVIYTLVATASGTITLPDAIGPNLQAGAGAGKYSPSPTICTAAQNTAALGKASPGDAYSVQVVATDYPVYEANSIFGVQKPTIVGAGGQSDVTISIPEYEDQYGSGDAYAPNTQSKVRKAAPARVRASVLRKGAIR